MSKVPETINCPICQRGENCAEGGHPVNSVGPAPDAVIVMSLPKRFTISLEVSDQDSYRRSFVVALTPIGTLSTEEQDSFWTRLLYSFQQAIYRTMQQDEGRDSSPKVRVGDPRS